MLDTTMTLVGYVVTEPRSTPDKQGRPIVHFRLKQTSRRFDGHDQVWVDKDTVWAGVTCFRQLARNAEASVHKGDRVVVIGRLRTVEWEENGQPRSSLDLTAEALGHDLAWGTSEFVRSNPDRAEEGQAEADGLARALDEEIRAARLAGEPDDPFAQPRPPEAPRGTGEGDEPDNLSDASVGGALLTGSR